jgi:hypothetical protein
MVNARAAAIVEGFGANKSVGGDDQMTKQMRVDDVVKKTKDSQERPRYKTTFVPKKNDLDEGVEKARFWSDERIAQKGDEVPLDKIGELLRKAEAQSDFSDFTGE